MLCAADMHAATLRKVWPTRVCVSGVSDSLNYVLIFVTGLLILVLLQAQFILEPLGGICMVNSDGDIDASNVIPLFHIHSVLPCNTSCIDLLCFARIAFIWVLFSHIFLQTCVCLTQRKSGDHSAHDV